MMSVISPVSIAYSTLALIIVIEFQTLSNYEIDNFLTSSKLKTKNACKRKETTPLF